MEVQSTEIKNYYSGENIIGKLNTKAIIYIYIN